MKKLRTWVLLICLGAIIFSCASREVREEYYDPSSYGQGGFYHPWNDPMPDTFR